MTEKQTPYIASHAIEPALGHFDYAVKKLLSLEGGEVNDADDPGGHTNFGISKRSFPDEDIEKLTEARAIALYREYFWEPNRYGEINDREIAAEMLELAAVAGSRTANCLLQRSINRVISGHVMVALTVDGIIGPKTLAYINIGECYISGDEHYYSDYLLCALRLLEISYFLSLGNDRFLKGWIRRALA